MPTEFAVQPSEEKRQRGISTPEILFKGLLLELSIYHFQSLLTNVAYSYRIGHVLDTLIEERIDYVFESNTFVLSKDIV